MNIGAYTKPIFDKITEPEKWYAGIPIGVNKDGQTEYMQPNHAWNIKKRFADGTLKISTLLKLLQHFGYEIQEIIWIKKVK